MAEIKDYSAEALMRNEKESVELDTDGVNEESVEIKDAPQDEDPSELKKQDVDLGYTEHNEKRVYEKKKDHGTDISYENEREQKLEQKEEEEDKGELGEYSDKVQKRIKKLTFQVREAERREKAAIDYAKGIKDKFDTVDKKLEETDTNYLKEYDAKIDAQRDQAKNKLKSALDENNTDLIMEANDELTKLAVEKEKVSMTLGEKEARKKEAESQTQQQV